MCLIAYVPAGKILPQKNIEAAHLGNSDGIGVMSADGVEKFVGRKALKRAKRYIRRLQDGNREYAVHFRYATHGDVTLANCHPHRLPNGNGYMMHNGILSDYSKRATARYSDTALYAAIHTSPDASDVRTMISYWDKQGKTIGGNKLCILLPTGNFLLVNDHMGEWIEGVWYSQTYSLPGSYGSRWYNTRSLNKFNDYGYPLSTDDYDYGYGRGRRVLGYDREEGKLVEYKPVTDLKTATDNASGHTYWYKNAEGHWINSKTQETRADEWQAWDRDRDGNYVAPEDRALDAELKRHIIDAEYEQGCCTMCGKAKSLDADMVCADCGYELAAESDCMLPGWSNVGVAK